MKWARLLAVLALSAALVGLYHWIRHGGIVVGRAEVQSQWDAERLDIAKQTLRIIENNTRATQHLQAHADQGRKALREDLRRIAADLDDAERRLRERPERPADGGGIVPSDPGAGGTAAGATGAELYREDGRFLAGEAARADQLRAALRACYADYRAARAAVNGAAQ